MYLMGCSNWYLALSDSGKLKRGLELRVVSDSTCQTERASESIWYSYASLGGVLWHRTNHNLETGGKT